MYSQYVQLSTLIHKLQAYFDRIIHDTFRKAIECEFATVCEANALHMPLAQTISDEQALLLCVDYGLDTTSNEPAP